MKIVDGKGDLPEVDVLRVDVAQRRWVLLLNQVFEDADIFGLRNLDSEHPIGIVAKNKAIERKMLGGIEGNDGLDLF